MRRPTSNAPVDDYRINFSAAVPGVGAVATQRASNASWVEYDARVGFARSPHAGVDVFTDGVAGNDRIESNTHFGGSPKRYPLALISR